MATEEWRRKNSEKLREYRRRWYARNKQSAKAAVRQRKRKIRDWLDQYKLTLKCSSCSETHPACLEFHHPNPADKEIDVSRAIDWGWSTDRTMREINKCIVLCANCHRKLHWA